MTTDDAEDGRFPSPGTFRGSGDARVDAAVTEERNRIAREIHDTLAQAFTAILLQVRIAQRIMPQRPEEAWLLVERVGEMAAQGLAEARRSVWELQPESARFADVAAALTAALGAIRENADVEVALHVGGEPRLVSPDIGLGLVRIAEEAVNNALQHGLPNMVWVDLAFRAGDVRLCIQDDGCGFDTTRAADSGGFGLISIAQRASRLGGQYAIASSPGRGTEVSVTAPTPTMRAGDLG